MKLGHPGLAGRAQHILDSAMQRGRYKWGRKAKLTAGAGIAIALREAHKADSIRDIAYLLEEPLVSLSRSFMSVTQLLEMSLASADPSLHLPSLQTHLLSLISAGQPEASLPLDLLRTLKPLTSSIPSIIQTATSLSCLVTRLDRLAELPTGPTACAILVLAIEAELETSLPNAGALAQVLGARVGVSKRVVMERYKWIYDGVEEWIREVPWLQAHERRKGTGRSKVAKRVVVARGLKDVVRFQEELWRKRTEGLEKPVLNLECEGSEDESDGGALDDTLALSAHAPTLASGSRHPQVKRVSAHQRAIATTSQFLLSPLSCSSSPATGVDTASTGKSADPDLFHHLLTVDDAALEHAFSGSAPTRLQKLVAVRGDADLLDDDELFEEGELEGMLRSEEEREALQVVLGWEDSTAASAAPPPHEKEGRGKRKRGEEDPAQAGEAKAKRTRRIDMDALARVLGSDDLTSDFHDDEPEDGGYESGHSAPYSGNALATEEYNDTSIYELVDGEEVVGEWRPMSPGGGGYDDERKLTVKYTHKTSYATDLLSFLNNSSTSYLVPYIKDLTIDCGNAYTSPGPGPPGFNRGSLSVDLLGALLPKFPAARTLTLTRAIVMVEDQDPCEDHRAWVSQKPHPALDELCLLDVRFSTFHRAHPAGFPYLTVCHLPELCSLFGKVRTLRLRRLTIRTQTCVCEPRREERGASGARMARAFEVATVDARGQTFVDDRWVQMHKAPDDGTIVFLDGLALILATRGGLRELVVDQRYDAVARTIEVVDPILTSLHLILDNTIPHSGIVDDLFELSKCTSLRRIVKIVCAQAIPELTLFVDRTPPYDVFYLGL
ncbi:hypothetical protein EUX98_g1215 [Antrodiella citrinella]|uniref:Uncharacterized protein n=1 Tax=Antrodiella citrinella TaxID=2447956 RepID=A0A4S4NAP7_9APHY|nr:hypothetical protein EUX98_g1215 [Antrodiella citrinella]